MVVYSVSAFNSTTQLMQRRRIERQNDRDWLDADLQEPPDEQP